MSDDPTADAMAARAPGRSPYVRRNHAEDFGAGTRDGTRLLRDDLTWQTVSAGQTLYGVRDKLTAAGGENKVTLGATPLAGSEITFKNKTLLYPVSPDYTISGAVLSLGANLSAADVVYVKYLTTNAAAGAAILGTTASPTVRASAIAATTASNSPTLTLPASIAAGDLIILFAAVSGDSTATCTVTGYTSLGTPNAQSNGNANHSMTFGFTKTATGSEAGQTITFTCGFSSPMDTVVGCLIVTAGGWSAVAQSAQRASGTNGTTVTAQQVTTAAPNHLIVYLAGAHNSTALTSFTIATVTTDQSTIAHSVMAGLIAHEVQGSAATTTARTLTASATSGIGNWTLDIAP